MKGSKKINPRKKPVTEADLKRAKREALEEATQSAIAIMFTVLCDKEGASVEDIRRIWAEVNELSDSVIKGYVKISDLIQTQRDEYGIQIK